MGSIALAIWQVVKWVYIFVYHFEGIDNIFQFYCLFSVFGIYHIRQLHSCILILLQIIAHYHRHHCEQDIHIELIAFLNEQLIYYELRCGRREKCACQGESEVLKAFIELCLVFLGVRDVALLDELKSRRVN
jgi:hypothetical protein